MVQYARAVAALGFQGERRAPWQESRVRTALARGMFVFVGTSLVDPNLLRYLYADTGTATPPRYAIFVRQDTYERDVPEGVREARGGRGPPLADRRRYRRLRGPLR